VLGSQRIRLLQIQKNLNKAQVGENVFFGQHLDSNNGGIRPYNKELWMYCVCKLTSKEKRQLPAKVLEG